MQFRPAALTATKKGGGVLARRLKTITDIRRYLASLIVRLEDQSGGRLDAALAGRLGYLANLLLGAVKDSDIEARISRLEERLKNGH